MKGSLFATSLFAVAPTVAAAPTAAPPSPSTTSRSRRSRPVPDVDAAVKTAAADALKAELASPPGMGLRYRHGREPIRRRWPPS